MACPTIILNITTPIMVCNIFFKYKKINFFLKITKLLIKPNNFI